MVSTQKAAADWLSKSNRFQPLPPYLKKFGRGRSVQTVILVQPDRMTRLEREYVQLIDAGSVATFAGGPGGYGCTCDGMRWHSEHGMGHMWTPKDSPPAAGATRYGHGLTRRRTRERRTILWRCISGKFVELRPMTMETRCSKVFFPNYSKNKSAADTFVPPLWETRGKKILSF